MRGAEAVQRNAATSCRAASKVSPSIPAREHAAAYAQQVARRAVGEQVQTRVRAADACANELSHRLWQVLRCHRLRVAAQAGPACRAPRSGAMTAQLLLAALGHASPAAAVADGAALAATVAWLEDTKVRALPLEARAPLRDAAAGAAWEAAFAQARPFLPRRGARAAAAARR